MKQTATVVLFLLFTLPLIAQESETWPPSGAEWGYCVYGDYPSFSVWSHTFAYTTDTVIGSHTYAMVQLTEVNDEPLATDGSSWWIPEENMRTYFRQSGDTVYRYVNGQDYVFMIHGIEADEEFITFRSAYDEWEQWSCTDELPLMVLAADDVDHGDATYREVSLRDLDPYFDAESSMENIYIFIEGVGLKSGFTFLTPELIYTGETNQSGDLSECLGGVLHLPMSALYHYHDDTKSIDFFECDITVSTDDVNAEDASFLLFPNPTTGTVTVKTSETVNDPLQLGIYDLRGILLKEYAQVMPEARLDLNDLARGVYLIRAESSRGVHTQKLIIE